MTFLFKPKKNLKFGVKKYYSIFASKNESNIALFHSKDKELCDINTVVYSYQEFSSQDLQTLTVYAGLTKKAYLYTGDSWSAVRRIVQLIVFHDVKVFIAPKMFLCKLVLALYSLAQLAKYFVAVMFTCLIQTEYFIWFPFESQKAIPLFSSLKIVLHYLSSKRNHFYIQEWKSDSKILFDKKEVCEITSILYCFQYYSQLAFASTYSVSRFNKARVFFYWRFSNGNMTQSNYMSNQYENNIILQILLFQDNNDQSFTTKIYA